MGLFSKKKLVCEQCGKEYEARIAIGAHICPECSAKAEARRDLVRGYMDYASAIGKDGYSYSEAQLDEIAKHRDQILEKYRIKNAVTRDVLEEVSEKYKSLSDEEVVAFLAKCFEGMIKTRLGASLTDHLFIPRAYDRTVVDADDVFAVAFVSDYKMSNADQDAVLCAVFTNDPYLPVFPTVYVRDRKFLEFKSKAAREAIVADFTRKCPNLKYPVQELKLLKKQIKADGSVNGNIDKEFMLNQLSDADTSSGIFNTKKMESDVNAESLKMLEEYGYLQDTEISEMLGFNKMFKQGFWTKAIQRMASQVQ